MIRFAIIGAGRIGQVHARAIASHPQATLSLVYDAFDGPAKSLADAYGARYTLEVEDVYGADDVDAVIIGSPTAMHVEQILGAVKGGKRVMSEKPVALELDEAQRCLDELGAEATRVMLGFNRRFDPSFAEVNARVVAGEIGPLQQLTVTSRDPQGPPASYVAGSGGIFKDMTIHDFDMVRFFLGDIVEVSAFGTNADEEIRAAGDFDQAMVLLRNADGALATIVNSRTCAYGYDQRLEAFGADGALSADNLTATSVRAASATQTDARGPVLNFFLQRYEAAYRDELSAFIDAVVADGDVSPNVVDGVEALKLAEAATISAREGRVVRL